MVEGHPLFLLSVVGTEGRQHWQARVYTQRSKTHRVYPHREMDGAQPHLGFVVSLALSVVQDTPPKEAWKHWLCPKQGDKGETTTACQQEHI